MGHAPRLQFDRAAYDEAPASLLRCGFCSRGMDALQFEIYGRPACEICARQAQAQLPTDGRGVFARAVLFGALAALGSGLALLAAMQGMPGLVRVGGEFFAAWIVGWIVAGAVRTGARGAAGRKYQIIGCVLAYAAMVYPLQGFLLGFHEDIWWLYPMALLRPVALLFTEMRPLAGAELLAASIAMTWTWRALRGSPNPIRTVGPAA